MHQLDGRPAHLWIVGVASAMWNALGAFDFVMTQADNPAHLARFNLAHGAWVDDYPPLVDAAWAISAWSALAGSLLLLLRSRHALAAFGISLAGLMATTVYQQLYSPAPPGLLDPARQVMNLMAWAIAIGLLLYTGRLYARLSLR